MAPITADLIEFLFPGEFVPKPVHPQEEIQQLDAPNGHWCVEGSAKPTSRRREEATKWRSVRADKCIRHVYEYLLFHPLRQREQSEWQVEHQRHRQDILDLVRGVSAWEGHRGVYNLAKSCGSRRLEWDRRRFWKRAWIQANGYSQSCRLIWSRFLFADIWRIPF